MEIKYRPKISVVSYLNSKPFIYGFKKSEFNLQADISLDIPSVCADKLISGIADIGLIPVAILPQLKKYSIISNYCIGADGPVDSVLLLSNVPLKEIKSIYLDYQSRTSVMLTKVLCKNFWTIQPIFLESSVDYEKHIEGTTAGVVIGDRALSLKGNFNYCYDLSEEWKKMTNLPFVFATWTSVIDLDESFIILFNRSIETGMKMIDEISEKEATAELSIEKIKYYLSYSIDYSFNEDKKKAMKLFLEMCKDFN